MDINIEWQKPVPLKDGKEYGLLYCVEGLEKYKKVPGIYMFGRKYDGAFYPLYIGKSLNLYVRIWQQFKNKSLTKEIKKMPKGTKVLVIGMFKRKPGQNADRCIKLVEKALIDRAQTIVDELYNVQGTRTRKHEITFSGNQQAKDFSGKTMYRKIRRS